MLPKNTKSEGWLLLLKMKIASNVLLGMMILSVFMTKVGLAAEFPSLGDSRNKVEKHYGLPAVVLTRAWGYPVSTQGLKGTMWLEYDAKERVAKQMMIFESGIKIRDFAQYFPEMHTELTSEFAVTAVIRAYPRDQLAVRVLAKGQYELWIRFFFVDDDPTCINMHSKIKGFEFVSFDRAVSGEKSKTDKVVGCRLNSLPTEYPADGAWNKTDNYFLPRLFFSERLIPRRGTNLIVIHHAAMPTATTLQDIHELHLQNGWAGTGYHKLVFASGGIENGRAERMVGAHAAGANRHSLGIVLVGNFNKEPPASAHLRSAARLTAELMKKYHISAERVQPHRNVTGETDCPGALFPWEEFMRLVKAGVQ